MLAWQPCDGARIVAASRTTDGGPVKVVRIAAPAVRKQVLQILSVGVSITSHTLTECDISAKDVAILKILS